MSSHYHRIASKLILVLLYCCGCESASEQQPGFNEVEARAQLDKLVETRTAEIMADSSLTEDEKKREIEVFKAFAASQMKQVKQINEGLDSGNVQTQDDRDEQQR